MANTYFRAKLAWETGQMREGFALFEGYFRERVGQEPVFLVPSYLVRSAHPCSFETAVAALLTSTVSMSAEPLMQAPLGRVLPHLLALDPYGGWLDILVGYDFFAPPSSGASDMEDYAPVPNSDEDLQLIVDALVGMAQRGLLSGDVRDLPHGGRPVLTIERIEAVDPARWGALKPMLLAELPAAYAAAPADAWARLAAADPESVVARLLHHIVGRYHQVLSMTEIIWQLIQENHRPYGDAAQAALSTMMADSSASRLADLVRYDAGKPNVKDARAWLTALESALQDGDFSRLADWD
jgi:hypothetical protein